MCVSKEIPGSVLRVWVIRIFKSQKVDGIKYHVTIMIKLGVSAPVALEGDTNLVTIAILFLFPRILGHIKIQHVEGAIDTSISTTGNVKLSAQYDDQAVPLGCPPGPQRSLHDQNPLAAPATPEIELCSSSAPDNR